MTRFITSTKVPLVDSSKFSIIILSSLPSGRSASSTSISLNPVNSKEIVLDVQYDTIRAVFPKADIFMVTGFNTPQIVNRKPGGLRIIENAKYDETGETGELKLALNAVTTSSVITVSGDILFNDAALSQIKTKHSSIITDNSETASDNVGTISDKSKLENMAFGLSHRWCGIAHFTGKELELLKNVVNTRNKSNLCYFEIINYIIQNKGGIIYTVQHNNGYIRKIEK